MINIICLIDKNCMEGIILDLLNVLHGGRIDVLRIYTKCTKMYSKSV